MAYPFNTVLNTKYSYRAHHTESKFMSTELLLQECYLVRREGNLGSYIGISKLFYPKWEWPSQKTEVTLIEFNPKPLNERDTALVVYFPDSIWVV